MSKQDPAEQVKFLVNCIAFTTNGRPDFQQVADSLEIVSKAAAQKRYERLLKSYNITAKGGATTPTATDDKSAPSTPAKTTKRKAPAAGAGSAKKRGKATPKKEEDDEDTKPVKAKKAPAKKSQVKEDQAKKEEVKDEDDAGSTSELTDLPASEEEDAKSESSTS